ncbi:MAG: hypothetical protein ACREAQ_08280 [Nitrososphaera sp.]
MTTIPKETPRANIKTVGFLIITVLFFAATLLGSFFVMIVLINELDVDPELAPNIFMIGLVPPSILTILLYFKVFGRFM